MSVRLMSIVLGAGCDHLASTERFVLLALADAANDDGVTWLPIVGKADKRSLCRKTSLSERGVQNCLRRLEADGHLSRVEKPGRGTTYTIHPRTKCTGANGAPVGTVDQEVETPGAQPAHEMHPRTTCTGAQDAGAPAPGAPKPSYKHSPPIEPDGSMPPQGGDEASTKPKRDRGTRIPEDWQPPAITELPDLARSKAQQWPQGAYETEAEAFRDYWLGEGRAGARKLDWNRAWYNRINEITARVLRDAKAGVVTERRPAAAAPAKLSGRVDSSNECESAVAIREELRRQLGKTSYEMWVGPVRLERTDQLLTIWTPTEFMSSYQQTSLAPAFRKAARVVIGEGAELKWRVHRSPP